MMSQATSNNYDELSAVDEWAWQRKCLPRNPNSDVGVGVLLLVGLGG